MLPRTAEIPVHHVSQSDREAFLRREDFFTHYEMREPGEIGCVFDRKTGKPIMRVVVDLIK